MDLSYKKRSTTNSAKLFLFTILTLRYPKESLCSLNGSAWELDDMDTGNNYSNAVTQNIKDRCEEAEAEKIPTQILNQLR